MDEQWFKDKIDAFCSAQTAKQRQMILSRLMPQIARLPGLAKNNNPAYQEDYEEIFNDVMIEVGLKICSEFDPQHESIKKSLESWINYKLRLRYKVLDMYEKKPPFSLDATINDDGDSFADFLKSPTTEGLDLMIAQEQEELEKEKGKVSSKIMEYF